MIIQLNINILIKKIKIERKIKHLPFNWIRISFFLCLNSRINENKNQTVYMLYLVCLCVYDTGKFALSVLVIVRYIFIIKCNRVSVLTYTLITIGATIICIVSSWTLFVLVYGCVILVSPKIQWKCEEEKQRITHMTDRDYY